MSVAILDVNDESPQFTSPAYSFGIEENLAAGYEVGHLRAEDRDDYPHNSFSFSFLPTGRGYHVFRIDEKTGKITTTRSLDREEVGVYRLTARVRDDGAPSSLYSTASVTVYVMDVNDNQPMFSASSSDAEGVKNTVVRIPKQTSAGSVIMQVCYASHNNNNKVHIDILGSKTSDHHNWSLRSTGAGLENVGLKP